MILYNTILGLQMLVAMLSAAATPSIACSVDNIDSGGKQWVDSVYDSLSERERVAQLFVPRLDINSSVDRRLSELVKAGIGGFLLGKGSLDEYVRLINLGCREAKVPLMVTLDGEWGLAMRIADTPKFPRNGALGEYADELLMEEYGAEVARECKALGISVDFAPVLDVNSNPANPVIGTRSLSSVPARVAALGVAFSRGLERGGVLSVAKHFPGHGDTSTDSHKTLPTVDRPRSVLDSVELLPFRSYIDAGLSGVMVGHLNVPALDATGTPASLSQLITTGLLKNELGFRGLIFTDALEMKGARSGVNNCVAALLAGADVLLGSGSPMADIDAVLSAVKCGTVSRDVIKERCKKMLAYKWALGLSKKLPPLKLETVKREINNGAAEKLLREFRMAQDGYNPHISRFVDSIVDAAMRAGAFPGCQVYISRGGDVLVDKSYGVTSTSSVGAEVKPTTLYDIASMTKATATLSAVMLAIDRNLMALDDTLARFLPEVENLPVGSLTIRQLLTHESGLPASINLYKLLADTATFTPPLTSKTKRPPYTLYIEDGLYGNSDAQLRADLVSDKFSKDFYRRIGKDLFVGDAAYDTIMSRIESIVPSAPQYKYSDLNFCLLMAAVESATGEEMDSFLASEIFTPLGMRNTMFRPSDDDIPLDGIAPTEYDNYLRRQLVHGYVHDELAAFSGGVQGNAGLFSTASDIARLCRFWLDGGAKDGKQLISKDTVEKFLAYRTKSGRRGLGFDRLSLKDCGKTFVGHTGFTGTCFWIDPDNDVIFVFLSNRVHPSRSNKAFANSDIRRKILRSLYL